MSGRLSTSKLAVSRTAQEDAGLSFCASSYMTPRHKRPGLGLGCSQKRMVTVCRMMGIFYWERTSWSIKI